MKKTSIACAAIVASASLAAASVATFDDLAVPLSGYENGEHLSGAFTSNGASFNNFFDDSFGPYWEGFSYSSKGDTTDGSFLNQYSSFAGGGSSGNGSAVAGNTFALGYVGFTIPTITLGPDQSRPLSLRVTNTTYAALSMRNGDAFAKKFGGASGNDPDFFKLTINAFDAGNVFIGSQDVYLADFRFADNSRDYIMNTWTDVNLSSLGSSVRKLQFTLASSDNGAFGMNTPAYFAIDNVSTVPEPGNVVWALSLCAAIGLRRRKN